MVVRGRWWLQNCKCLQNLHLRDCKRLIFQCSITPFSMLAILIAHMSTEVIEPAVPMESALLLGQALTAFSLSTTQRTWLPFILAAGTLAPTLIWHLSVLVQIAVYLTDASFRRSLGHNIDSGLLFHQNLLCLFRASLLSDGTSARLTGATTTHQTTNLPGVCCHKIHRMWIWPTRTSAISSEQQPKILSHAVVEITTYRVGMLSARTCTMDFCSRLKEATLTGLPLPCYSGSTRNAEIDGPKQFRLSTFCTLVEKHGVY